MECPKGYQMGSNGVCQQVGGYARGGMTPRRNSKPLLNSREEYTCDDAMQSISECHSQSGQSTGPGQCFSTTGCNCTDAGSYWPPESWNWYGYCMCMPTWDLLQYAANCRYAGPQFSGQIGGQGSVRRIGGPIRRRRRR